VRGLHPIEDPTSPAGRLSQRLRDLAEAAGFSTLDALAKKASYANPTVSEALAGKADRVPSEGVVEAICKASGGTRQQLTELLELRRAAAPARLPTGKQPPNPPPPVELPQSPGDPPPDHGRWRREASLISGGGLLLVIVLIVAWLVWPSDDPADPCQGPGLLRSGHFDECVGVTDGAFAFAPELGLQAVLNRIKHENDEVTRKAAADPDVGFVSVGYVVPLPRDATAGLATALRHELQGAYLAQWRANHKDGLGDSPLIRILVVNVGDASEQQAAVIPEVIRRASDPAQRLVAVAGLGQSLDGTKRAIRSLAEARAPTQPPRWAGIPMIASRLTADDLSTEPGQPVPGLFRISPPNSAQTAVAAAALKPGPALLVQDINQGDAYTNSLAEQFRRVFAAPPKPGVLLEEERYNSALPALENTFVQMMFSICARPVRPNAVYYAGRGINLPSFIAALAGRPCELPLVLFTGDDGVDLTAALRSQDGHGGGSSLSDNLRRDITVRYTALAHPASWFDEQQFPPTSIRIFQDDCATCFNQVFAKERLPDGTLALDDGAAITGYDALLVAIRAIRAGVGQGPAPIDPDTIDPGTVLQQMYRITSAIPVPGASGPLGFDQAGIPINKPIPILELKPDGTTTHLGTG
jgi:Helix-turn-helix domain